MNPYDVMGLPRNASEEDVKKRYRALVKQFHPDLHPDDPNAARHMSEINSAYEAIRSGGGGEVRVESHFRDGSFSGAPSGTWTDEKGTHYYAYEDISDIIREMFGMEGSGSISDYEFVEMYISQGMYQRAARMLDNMPKTDPRWYYNAAQIYEHTGDDQKAEQYARAAMHMCPGEPRYTAYWQSLVMADEERGLAREKESVILKNIPRIIAVLTAAALAALALRPVIAGIMGHFVG